MNALVKWKKTFGVDFVKDGQNQRLDFSFNLHCKIFSQTLWKLVMVRPKTLSRNLAIVDSALPFRAIWVVAHPSSNYLKRLNEKFISEKKSHIQLAVGNIYKI